MVSPVDAAERRCPCGTGLALGECCGPLIAGQPAPTPEKLMRSRYTAYVMGAARYLSETWHPGTRPDEIDPDPDIRWQGLEIVDVSGGAEGDRRGVVEFRAHYRVVDGRGVLRNAGVQHERSRFVRQSDRWWYLDGEVSGLDS